MTVYTGGWQEAPRFSGIGLFADAGKYLGPWPPEDPLKKNMPLDAAEIDFIVAIPNPDGKINDLTDGSYPTVWRLCGTFWTGTPGGDVDSFDNDTVASGGATLVEAVPPGAHLFVGWYDLNFSRVGTAPQPSKSVLQVVNFDYVRGGRGWSRKPSHWSGWRPGWQYANTAPLQSAVTWVDPDTATASGATQSLRVIAATSGVGADHLWGEGPGSIRLGRFSDTGSVATVTERQMKARFAAEPPDSSVLPPGMARLKRGVDYGRNPFSHEPVGYQADLATAIAVKWHLTGELVGTKAYGPDGTAPYRIGWAEYATIGPDDLDPSGGTHGVLDEIIDEATLQDVTLPLTNPPTVVPFAFDVHDALRTDVVPAALRTFATLRFTRNDGGGETGGVPPQPSPPTPYDWYMDVRLPDVEAYTWQTPPWRYWQLGPLVPPPNPYLRFNQRNDGLGIFGHPRLPGTQHNDAPRVGGNNTYQ